MGRPKAFDREEVLEKAAAVFWEKGFEATSTDDLLAAMGIGRQSMYDTFGDKHALYVAALEKYREHAGRRFRDELKQAEDPRAAIEAMLLEVSGKCATERARGCLLVNATTELAPHDEEVAKVVRKNNVTCEGAFETALRHAVELGQVPRGIDTKSVARFLYTTLQGLRVSAKAGTPPSGLREVARVALSVLERA
jgi:TetR/AcrR family transcriptional regulator, transcriptional repressor for nem operon